ncbi:hypothetical protein HPQ32_04280 [Photobacterium carnosum]|uniref:DUF6929 family protein n=1 Tax=Photobacterium carnosum TaxID=2023717 RepID=UPI001C91BEF0|nr:hypothetical protein [Photobacterium carnosum]MBY3787661.1 hypothetical protein [Photobacterium carnosum]MCD9532291.1 hypothetical protein [Photobacterium carnosum]
MNIKKIAKISILSALTLLVTGCSPSADSSHSFTFDIANSTINHNLSSGSGMVVNNGKLMVVGDDSPWLFSVNNDFKINTKTLIDQFPVNEQNRINHKIKPDFESMTMVNYLNKPYYLVMGSGSKAVLREQAYLMPVNGGENQKLSLSNLYAQLHKAANFTQQEKINIEGIANTGNEIFIFNRGNEGKNAIFTINEKELMDYLEGKIQTLPSLKVYQVQLPKINGVQACFSGADYWKETNSMVFTASVEGNNESSINDGAIQGSFIGVLPLKALVNKSTINLTTYSQEIKNNGKAVITKAESIAIENQTNKQANGYIVSDNDNGTSQFFTFTINE